MKLRGRDVDAWAHRARLRACSPPSRTIAATRVLRVGADRRRAPGGHRSAARCRHRSGVVARRQHAGVQCRRADRAAVALAVARRRRARGMAARTGAGIRRLRRSRTGGRGRASTARASPAGSRCRAARSPPAAIPRSSGSMAGRSARRGRISGPTCRCCSRRASPCCCRTCAAVPATAAPIPRATMSNGGSTAWPISRMAGTGSPRIPRSTPSASASWVSRTAASW